MQLSEFFDLSLFAHRALFEIGNYPWDALKHLGDYLHSCKLGQIHVEIPDGATLVNPELISIASGTLVEPGALIEGPCVIGPNSEIRHGAYLRGNVLVGKGAIIGHSTEVKNSIFLDGAKAPHFNYVGDSILGNRVNLGAGVKCANFRLDEKVIHISGIDTGMQKIGAIIGDDSSLGCNSVTNPGTVIYPESFIYPCSSINGIRKKGLIYDNSPSF